MKKVFTAGLVLASSIAFSQSAKVVSAYNYTQKGELDKAWENIEAASQDPKTSVEAKTWKYRFDVLFAISQSPKLEYRSLVKPEELANKMKESYQKTKELDTKNKFLDEIEAKIKLTGTIKNNQGIEAYTAAVALDSFKDTLNRFGLIVDNKSKPEGITANLEALKQKANKNEKGKEEIVKCLDGDKSGVVECLNAKSIESYKLATLFFTQSVAAFDIIGLVDSGNVFNAAICAERAGLKKEAAQLYLECTKIKYGGARVYSFAAKINKELGNKDQQLNIIKEGRVAYPEDLDLLVDELNMYLEAENYVESEKLLKAAIAKTPTNENMFFVLGSTYDKLANPTDKATGKDLPKPSNYAELVAKALDSYKKAIDLKPDFFDALYNYGALLFNEGVELNNKANDLDFRTKKAQVDELNRKADLKFKDAVPIFERALALKGDDVSVLQSLKQLYLRLEMSDKLQEVTIKLKASK